jgi:hypothetical protein
LFVKKKRKIILENLTMTDQERYRYIQSVYRAQFLQLQKVLETDYATISRELKTRIMSVIDKYTVNGAIPRKALETVKNELAPVIYWYQSSLSTWLDNHITQSIGLAVAGQDTAGMFYLQSLIANKELASGVIKDALSGRLPVLIRTQYGTGLDRYLRDQIWDHRWSDGFKLSDRVWRIGTDLRNNLDGMIETCVNNGFSAVDFSRAVELYLNEPGPAWTTKIKPSVTGQGSVKYNALRLARTETNQGYHRAQNLAAQKSILVKGIQWNLSRSHPKKDICDVWASQNIHGLGPGVYRAGETPIDHPQGLCFLTDVLFQGEDLFSRIRAKYDIPA